MSPSATPAAAGLPTEVPAEDSLAGSPPGTSSLAPRGGLPRWPLGRARSRSVTYTVEEPLRVAIVAGALSGDLLGAALIPAIRAQVPNAQFFGVAGPKMSAAGCEAWATTDQLSVM